MVEDQLVRHLLRRGFSLLGLRVYETLLGHKLLKDRFGEDVEVVLLGHSGGSVSNNIVIRVTREIDAAIIDAVGTYLNAWNVGLTDEIALELHRYRLLINDFSTAPMPVLRQAYGYPEGWGLAKDFLQHNLESPATTTYSP